MAMGHMQMKYWIVTFIGPETGTLLASGGREQKKMKNIFFGVFCLLLFDCHNYIYNGNDDDDSRARAGCFEREMICHFAFSQHV